MKVETIWHKQDGFRGTVPGCEIQIGASVPSMYKTSITPYELFLLSLGSSTGLSMLPRLSEFEDEITEFKILTTGQLVSNGLLKVFEVIELRVLVKLKGDPIKIVNAVEFAQYSACGISAMVSKFCSVRWVVEVNDRVQGEGIANFEF